MQTKPKPPKKKQLGISYWSAIIFCFLACLALYRFCPTTHISEPLSQYKQAISSYSYGSQAYRSKTLEFIRSINENYPVSDSGDIEVSISKSVKRENRNISIGSDWKYYYYINDVEFHRGTTISINLFKPNNIRTKIIEQDPTYNDVGTTEDSISFSLDDLIAGKTITQTVEVSEYRGGVRSNTGGVKFNVSYTIKLKKKLQYPFLKEVTRNPFLYIGFSVIIIFAILIESIYIRRKKNQYQKEYEQYEHTLEQFESEKKAFIQTLNGFSIRELAGVPNGVFFTKDNLPYNSKSNEKFGTFTLYITPKGYCFHTDKTCPKSYNVIPINLVKVASRKPCIKCAKGYNCKIPSWYTAYLEYLMKIKNYEITDYIEQQKKQMISHLLRSCIWS